MLSASSYSAERMPAEAAVARALEAKDHPAIRQIKDLSEKRGRADGLAWSILAAFQARKVEVSEKQRQRILATTQLETLELWLPSALAASSPTDLI